MLPAGSLFSRLARNSRVALFVDHETKPLPARSFTDFRLSGGFRDSHCASRKRLPGNGRGNSISVKLMRRLRLCFRGVCSFTYGVCLGIGILLGNIFIRSIKLGHVYMFGVSFYIFFFSQFIYYWRVL